MFRNVCGNVFFLLTIEKIFCIVGSFRFVKFDKKFKPELSPALSMQVI